MHIILEGCDKAGKTTLASILSKKLKFPIKKFSAPDSNPYAEYCEFLIKAKEPHIIDRYYLGDLVYGPIKRGGSYLNRHKQLVIEMLCLARNTINIYAYNSKSFIARKFIEDNETYSKISEINWIQKLYEKSIKSSILEWIPYTIGDKPEKFVDLYTLTNKSVPNEVLMRSRTLGTPSLGKYLFVGEQYGPRLTPPLLPFANGSGSKLLFESIETSKINIKDCLITNYLKVHDKKLNNELALKTEISQPGIQTVIALGDKSFHFCEQVIKKHNLSVILAKIPHPSYYARFNGIAVKKYSKIINQLV